jgi:hypothetical protein
MQAEEINPQQMLGRLMPLFMVLFFSMLMNFASSGISNAPT